MQDKKILPDNKNNSDEEVQKLFEKIEQGYTKMNKCVTRLIEQQKLFEQYKAAETLSEKIDLDTKLTALMDETEAECPQYRQNNIGMRSS